MPGQLKYSRSRVKNDDILIVYILGGGGADALFLRAMQVHEPFEARHLKCFAGGNGCAMHTAE